MTNSKEDCTKENKVIGILVDWQIERYIKCGWIMIFPLMKGAIQSNSVDLRLGGNFATYEASVEEIDPFDKDSVNYGLTTIENDTITLFKGGFLLAETMEQVELPSFVCATIEGKSSLSRLGVTVHQTGGWIDCGFRGTITLELTNENVRPIVLRAGMPIAQIVFYGCADAKLPYNERASAKYKNQKGATGSKYYLNVRRK